MDKKIVTIIIVLVLIVLVGGVIAFMSINKTSHNTNLLEQNSNNTDNNQISNKEENIHTISEEDIKNTTKDSEKILVVYYSRSGNTKQIAEYIKEKVGADILKIETVKTYPINYDEMLDYAKKEQSNGERPELKTININIEEYDTIFLGYPIWWGEIATPVYTFLDQYDLSEKKIAPFVTSGSSGLSGTPDDIKREEPKSEVLEAMSITSSTLNNYKSLTDNWLSKLGY